MEPSIGGVFCQRGKVGRSVNEVRSVKGIPPHTQIPYCPRKREIDPLTSDTGGGLVVTKALILVEAVPLKLVGRVVV